ncbi:MAG TPA: potassium-transporting ATPase subunit KdpC [Syntrophales bacterium]|nr:potassium-transporting ATPase subunit KdpC [Syntrophales bacterium]
MKSILKELRISLVATLCLAVILCGIYPMVVWGLAQGLLPEKANGSLVVKGAKTVGSNLLAQGFAGAKYFHPRPSAAGSGYDAAGSGGSNLGPLSKKLIDDTAQRVRDYRAENYLAPGVRVPADAVSASGSGLDPHISPENALLQALRVARARGLTEEDVIVRIKARTEGRTLGILGEPRVNVLMLNLDLDGSP